MALAISGPDPNAPQPGTPPLGNVGEPLKFTFFIYDHLGNSRILYANKFEDCAPAGVRYLLEHVLDYYPYGKTLREYVHNRERFQTTGHERDAESGLDHRGARNYDGDVGRFLSVDPLAADYAGWSSFSYAFNNPIRFIDLDGRSADDVILKYSNDDIGCSSLGTFLNQVNQNFAGQFEARTQSVYDKDGNVIVGQEKLVIVPTGGDLSKLSEGAQNFYTGLTEVTDNPSFTVVIGLVAGEKSVATGNYDLSQIDVADIGQFPVLDQSLSEQPGPTQAGKILHEVKEQFAKQVSTGLMPGQKGSFGQKSKDHRTGVGFEDYVNRNTRLNDEFNRSGVTQRFQLQNGKINEYFIGTTGGVISVNKINR